MLTGVRIGESAARDQRIALSCTKDGGECGQGWFQQTTSTRGGGYVGPIAALAGLPRVGLAGAGGCGVGPSYL
jgi:hypothetical protein